MSKGIVLALLLATSLVGTLHAANFHDSNIATPSDLEEDTSDGRVWFIKFYAEWCGHCKKLHPTWSALAAEFAGSKNVAIAHVDCTAHKAVCTDAEVRGYPTLKVFYEGEPIDDAEYRGPRDLASLKKFITSKAEELTQETEE